MKHLYYQQTALINNFKLLLLIVFLTNCNFIYSQQQNVYVSPEGVLDKVLDARGIQYNLADLLINDSSSSGRSVLVSCTSTSIFNLYFEPGCGMEDTSQLIHNQRRAVICKVFQDISDFLSPPGAALQPSSTTKINIWVKNFANENAPAGTPALASSYFLTPASGTSGILDGEIWKTIHLGVDSYTNVVSAPNTFYHGKVAINFNDPAIQWYTTLTSNAPTDKVDLYTAILHEIMHALGLHTFINENGASLTNANYYTRFDTFLKTNPGVSLLTRGACSMYDVNFAVSPTVLRPTCGLPNNINPDTPLNTTVCNNVIYYVGSSTIPVYTPICYEPGSSLSHFEDLLFPSCAVHNTNDSYFVVSNALPNGVTKRFLKPEERNALCDIGYSVKTSFGVSGAYVNGSNTFYTYVGAAVCGGINVAGLNDGITSGSSTYSFIGSIATAGATSTTVSLSKLLDNDTLSATSFECLQDVLAPTTTQLSATSGTRTTPPITFTTTTPGLHLLRYVPVNNAGQRGNITYVYVYIIPPPNPGRCSPTPSDCDLVLNGNFEQFSPTLGLPTDITQIIRACGWDWPSTNIQYACSYFNTSVIPTSGPTAFKVDIPCNTYGFQDCKNNIGNGYANIYRSDHAGKCHLLTTLKTLLQSNTTYQLSFDVSLEDTKSNFASNLQAYLSNTLVALDSFNLDLGNLTNPLLTATTVKRNTTGWETITFTFTTTTGGEKYLYLGFLKNSTLVSNTAAIVPGCNNSDTTYATLTSWDRPLGYYVDNVSLIPTNGAIFDLPTSICTNQTLTNITTYLAGAPTNGFFTGNGVILANGIYSFSPSIAGVGTSTIGYTYTSSNCIVTLYETITVTNTTVVTPTFTFGTTLCYGATAPVLPNTSTNGIVGIWSPASVSNTASVNYVFTPNIGQCASVTTVRITTNSYPAISSLTPTTQTVCLNSATIPLQIVVGGIGLTYQWYSNTTATTSGGTLLSGATNSSYIPITTVVGTKYYYVIVSRDSCITTSNVLTVIVATGNANPGTLSGTQILCKVGKINPTTTFTASVAGGTWSTSNALVATIVSVAGNTATIRATAGTATITYTVTGAGGCTASITRTVTTTVTLTPTFTPFPVNPVTGEADPVIICSGTIPPALPLTSTNGITGTWDPPTINNTASGDYIFTPTNGQCANSLTQSVIVMTANNFVANTDTFYITQPVTALITNSVLTNDTYNSNYLVGGSLPSYVTYTTALMGTSPTITPGGITFNNSTGTFTVQPGTPTGTYTYYYVLQTPCGPTGVLTPINTCTAVNIIVSGYVAGLNRSDYSFCFNNNSPTVSTSNLIPYQGQYSLFNGTTIGGIPANSSNAVIQMISPANPSLLPAGIVINFDGTFTIPAGTLPSNYTFYYQVCSPSGGYCSGSIRWNIDIKSPLHLVYDSPTYNTSGILSSGGSYNVLTNDWRNLCDTTVNGTNIPLAINTVTLSGSTTTPYPYFTIQNNGNIFVNSNVGPTLGVIPTGNYVLTYTVCDNTFPALCATQTITIYVNNTFKMLPSSAPRANIAPWANVAIQSIFQFINFPDANLKAKLLDPVTCLNTSNNFILADSNGDGEIDTNEALQIGTVNLVNANISNLAGLEYFTNLTSIALGQNNVNSFDIVLPNLSLLSIQNNPLTSFNPLILTNLTGFNCSHTLLTSLNTSNNYLLTNVNIANTQITSLDLGTSHNLTYLYCKNNPNLTSINIKNTSLLDYNSTVMQQDCWLNCPNLTNICADASEINALQTFLSGCGVNTSGININSNCALGIEDHALLSDVRIAPNPSHGVFEITVLAGSNEKTIGTVYNVLGQKVLSFNFTQNEKTLLDLSNYGDGVYFLMLKVGQTSVAKTILKE